MSLLALYLASRALHGAGSSLSASLLGHRPRHSALHDTLIDIAATNTTALPPPPTSSSTGATVGGGAGAGGEEALPQKLQYASFLTTLEDAQEMLNKHGVAVIPNVLDASGVIHMRQGMWELLAHLSQDLPVPITTDPATWPSYQQLRPLRKTMLHTFNVGQSQVAWDVRQNPAVANVFAHLWDCSPEDLLVGFDGLTVHFPPEIISMSLDGAKAKGAGKKSGKDAAANSTAASTPSTSAAPSSSTTTTAAAAAATGAASSATTTGRAPTDEELDNGTNVYFQGDWFHVDQSYTRPRLDCIQGLVTAYDVEEGDSTLAVLRGSHKYFGEFATRFNARNPSDWYPIRSEEHLAFYRERGCERVNVLCPAGSLVLWDSRTVHCGCLAQAGRSNPKIRFVVYVCMKPRSALTPSAAAAAAAVPGTVGGGGAEPAAASKSTSADAAKELEQILQQKRAAFRSLATTSHWPDARISFDPLPWSQREEKESTVPKVPLVGEPRLTHLGRRLAGLE